jgi:hypothetical protein
MVTTGYVMAMVKTCTQNASRSAGVLQKGKIMKIDKNVPIPAKGHKGKNDFVSEMKVGDSFLVPDSHAKDNMRFAFRYRGLKCIVRKVPEGYRIWRSE